MVIISINSLNHLIMNLFYFSLQSAIASDVVSTTTEATTTAAAMTMDGGLGEDEEEEGGASFDDVRRIIQVIKLATNSIY